MVTCYDCVNLHEKCYVMSDSCWNAMFYPYPLNNSCIIVQVNFQGFDISFTVVQLQILYIYV